MWAVSENRREEDLGSLDEAKVSSGGPTVSVSLRLTKGQMQRQVYLVPAEHFAYHPGGTIRVSTKSGNVHNPCLSGFFWQARGVCGLKENYFPTSPSQDFI